MTIVVNILVVEHQSSFHSDHQLSFSTGDGRTCLMVSGMVHIGFTGQQSGAWKKEDFNISVKIPRAPSGQSFKVQSWVPIVTPNSVQNENHAVNSGSGVTKFSLLIPEDRILTIPLITFIGEVAVRDVDQQINSLAYQATLIGEYVDNP